MLMFGKVLAVVCSSDNESLAMLLDQLTTEDGLPENRPDAETTAGWLEVGFFYFRFVGCEIGLDRTNWGDNLDTQ
jgi:hypothetical protein